MPARLLVRYRLGLLVLTGALVSSGCGGNPNLSSVTGTVTLDGQPLPEAFIKFIPTSGGTTSYGKTDSAGKYEMQFTDDEMGAWMGENRVEIRTGDVQGPAELVPITYNDETTLKAEVTGGENVFDFDLESDAGEIVQPEEE
jgi:hypothetical protein